MLAINKISDHGAEKMRLPGDRVMSKVSSGL